MKTVKRLAVWVALAIAATIPARAQFHAQQTYAGTAGGSASAITLTVPGIASFADIVGVPIRFVVASNSINGGTTVTVGGLAAEPLTRGDKTAVQAGDLLAGSIAEIMWDGTEYQIEWVGLQTSFLPASNVQTFSSSTTWTPPAGVFLVKQAQVWGSGGGGGGVSGSSQAACAGTPGGYASGPIRVTPGTGVTITIGAGGAGGTSGGGTGGNGATSSIGGAGTDHTISATGGVGGPPGGGGNAPSGGQCGQSPNPVGGTGSGGAINYTGGSAANGYNFGGTYVGSPGLGAPLGGSTTPLSNFTGFDGSSPGGAGGGAGGSGGSTHGGAGAAGLIIIQY